jgi:GNAT superfamily N-acetyltransferase
MSLPADLELRAPVPGDEHAIADMVAACDETYRAWAPPGWEPPPLGRELDRWRGRITDGSWWTRIAVEPSGGRVVGLVCFTQAVVQTATAAAGHSPVRAVRGDDGRIELEPIPHRAHVSAMFTHPDRWREGIAAAMLADAEDAMRAGGFREVQLWTPREAPARRFYEACGWRHDGREQWLDELALPIVAYVKVL